MKNIIPPVLLLLLCFAFMPSLAGQFPFVSGLLDDDRSATEQQMSVPFGPRLDLFPAFRSRVEAAVERRDFAEIEALYQTNDVAAGELKLELARWRPLFAQDARPRVFLYFKELSVLPPTARQFWSDRARRLTTHEVTHLVFFRYGTAASLVLPLVEVEGRLLIVPSDKARAGSGIEPGAAPNVGPATPPDNSDDLDGGRHR